MNGTEVFTLDSKKSHKPSILLVDDSADFIQTTKILLQEYDIRSANGGSEALALMEKEVPDIVLIDLVMPKMSGLELMRIVKDKYPKAIMAALTGIDEEETLAECRALGVTEYLIKGALTSAELKETIQRLKK
jgi:CheY-like chemotaxis protein